MPREVRLCTVVKELRVSMYGVLHTGAQMEFKHLLNEARGSNYQQESAVSHNAFHR